MPRQGPERVPVVGREHPDRLKEIDAAAAKLGLSRAAWLRRAHAYALLKMPVRFVDPNPPSDQGDG